jgi:hypothetical protein
MIHLSQTFHPTGDKEIPGLALGTVTLHNETTAPQPLVATTRLLSADGVLFRLKAKVVVPGNGAVDAEVYADKEGQGGNIPPTTFTIPGLNEAKQKVVYADSKEAMSGGVKKTGILSDDDIKKAETTLRVALVEAGKKQLSLGLPDKEGAVAVFEFIADTPATVGDEVADFVLNGRGKVVGAFYDGKEMRAKAMAMLLKKSVSNTEIIEPGKDAPTVTVERYDADSSVATLSVYQSGQATLNPESQEIQKTVFFGKSKDEVRRYLLSLSHVHAVDVVFRPAWMLSVPQIPDHVQVKVVNVE